MKFILSFLIVATILSAGTSSDSSLGRPEPAPTSHTPEPTSYALLGAGLMTAGLARKSRKK